MAYSFQTYTVGQVLTAAAMNQEEVNIRDHQHGIAGVIATMGTITPTSDAAYDLGSPTFRWNNIYALIQNVQVTDTTVVSFGNTATETVVFSYALPANVISSNRALTMAIMGRSV